MLRCIDHRWTGQGSSGDGRVYVVHVPGFCRMPIEEIEAAAMKLDPKAQARLAGKLLESLVTLSPQKNERLWAEEAQRRSAVLDAGTLKCRSAEDVFRDAESRI